MSVLGIDYGEKRIGLAISDNIGLLAHGLGVLENIGGDETVEAISQIVLERNVKRVVVGLPKNMNNTIGERAKAVVAFTKSLHSHLGVDVETWDERLTTRQAEEMLAGLSHKNRGKVVDTVSAQIILQSYLDAMQKCSSKQPY